MKIYSMTATFGRLEHETITLQPGLNVIEAPNEWGKSTWCAFLVNMLYGIDTKAKTTKSLLADKERYAPWSGSPMSGRMDLHWNGKDITIERRTKGRLIFGDFKAYETHTGIEIPELNSTNCGQLLLGVERSVFTRSSFLKLSDLPITQDDALRRRLNALVTTGDESGAGDKLSKTLRDLKNKCRYNRSGLLPQAEAQQAQLQQQIDNLQELKQQLEKSELRQKELSCRIQALENHRIALAYEAAQSDTLRVEAAIAAQEQAQTSFEALDALCASLPSKAEAECTYQELRKLQDAKSNLQAQVQLLPQLSSPPDIPLRYKDVGSNAISQAEADSQAYYALQAKKKKCSIYGLVLGVFGLLLLAAALLLYPSVKFALCLVLSFASAAMLISAILFGVVFYKKLQSKGSSLLQKYAPILPEHWVSDATDYQKAQQQYSAQLSQHQQAAESLAQRINTLDEEIARYTQGRSLSDSLAHWEQIISHWEQHATAKQHLQQLTSHAQALQSIVKPASPPQLPDNLDYSPEETTAMLTNAQVEQEQLHRRIGQLQGQAAVLGQEEDLRQQLKNVKHRITQLEDTYRALELAQNALSAATNELQRRFAPRISKRAQALFQKLTQGRYDRLTLSEDLSLNIGTTEEDTLRSSQWRSDGTIDQLYLALRLAVSEELTPNAPMILDDALVRFDDQRLAVAMDILQESSQSKQILLFTCQSREKSILTHKA